ncbi:coiled-coil domain-containing protein 66 isoform X1 [Esox lucius]|uniref:CCDC66 domain-containing protein n=2 Tax=Esox lucius TaxID=8010 RepID=A0AAY5K858_ESOLU|nr:coiled-coil domain-containing protein 66 isoform X1 [Esox lucius]
MNLGDGIMFQLENGKPRLILTNHGVEMKNPNKILTQIRPLNALNPKQFSHEVSEKSQIVQRKRAESRKAVLVSKNVPVKNDTPIVSSNVIKANIKCSTDHSTKAVSSAKGHRQTATDRPPKTLVKTVKESLVCMTNEQLQQILSTINKASTPSSQDPDINSQPQTGNPAHSKDDQQLNETGGETSASPNENSQEKPGGEGEKMDGQPVGLFSSLGEREICKDALEAKRTQWRRELDEQMALKKQQKELSRQDVTADRGMQRRTTVSSKPVAGNSHMERSLRRIGSGLEDGDSSQRELPAAIRSAFIVGEGTPVEHAFSAHKKEQQRRWLQDLDQQREEDKWRRQQEKQHLSQAEDHERWAMHFDSPQMRVPLQAPVGQSEPSSLHNHHRTRSGALSVAWDDASNYGEDSLGRASVETARTIQQKASHIRTMTALLDPAQIEERERKRLKQLEHQRAIEAQVEERRKKKQAAEATRKAEEQEEERRVACEREMLQRQYLLDTQRKMHKEEQQSRKQEELHLSVQRAKEEALKDKHQQRIKELARKGHDVSKLQRCLGGEPGTSQVLNTRDTATTGPHHYQTGREMETLREETHSTTFPSKDTAVQTEADPAVSPGFTYTVEASNIRDKAVQTPDIPVEYKQPPNAKRFRREARQEVQLAQKNTGHGKENTWLKDLGGGRGDSDMYDAFARTGQGQGRPRGHKAEWNIQKPRKPYIPASERYPAGLQHNRQESRLRRQMELMTLVERNTRTPHPPEPDRSPGLADPLPQNANNPVPATVPATQGRIKNAITGVTHAIAVHVERESPKSPPVPALKNRLQNPTGGSRPPALTQELSKDGDSPPPTFDYVPYLRTDEVYHMDPLAPISRPPTQTHTDAVRCGLSSPICQKDPLLHPERLRNTERQEAILKSLSKLRQGLLQKQRELETGLNPLRITEDPYSPQLPYM